MKTAILVVGAVLALGGAAHAEEYGRTGVIELGGTFGFESGTTKIEPDVGPSVEYQTTDMTIAPTFGFFVSKDIQAVARLAFVNRTIDFDGAKNTASSVGVDAGANYLVRVGKMRVGPQLLLGYSTATSKNAGDSDEFKESGPEVELGAVFKAPIGGGGLLGSGIGFRYSMHSFEQGSFKGSATGTDFAVTASFGVFF